MGRSERRGAAAEILVEQPIDGRIVNLVKFKCRAPKSVSVEPELTVGLGSRTFIC